MVPGRTCNYHFDKHGNCCCCCKSSTRQRLAKPQFVVLNTSHPAMQGTAATLLLHLTWSQPPRRVQPPLAAGRLHQSSTGAACGKLLVRCDRRRRQAAATCRCLVQYIVLPIANMRHTHVHVCTPLQPLCKLHTSYRTVLTINCSYWHKHLPTSTRVTRTLVLEHSKWLA